MHTLSTEQLLTWIRWYRRHRRTALARIPEDVPGTSGPDAAPACEPACEPVDATPAVTRRQAGALKR